MQRETTGGLSGKLGWGIGDEIRFYFNWHSLVYDWSMLYSKMNFSWMKITFDQERSLVLQDLGRNILPNLLSGETPHTQLTHIRPYHSFLLSAVFPRPRCGLVSQLYSSCYGLRHISTALGGMINEMLSLLILLISLPRKFFPGSQMVHFPSAFRSLLRWYLPSIVFPDYSI